MQDKNKAMCDPVIYRCNLTPHPRTATTYKMYPTYDFVCPIVDSSNRKLTGFVEQQWVTGWDDPRFATVRGIRQCGVTIEVLRTYILSRGASQRELSLEWDILWVTNKKVIDPVAPRHTALVKENLYVQHLTFSVKVKVVDKIPPSQKSLLKHKKNPQVGNKNGSTLYLESADAQD